MWRWFQRRARKNEPEELALGKRRAELEDLKLGVRERQLKVSAIERVVASEPDAVTALEVVAVATHRGKLPPAVYTRRKPEQSPLEALAFGMLQKQLTQDPTEALERVLDRQERLEEAAERLRARRRGEHYDEAETGNTFVDVARAVANSPLGEAIGNVLGVQAQQRMIAAAAAGAQTTGQAGVTPVDPDTASAEASTPPPPAAPSAIAAPRPVSFRVGLALRALKAMSPADGARWIMAQADQHEQLNDVVAPFIAAEPAAVPTILEAYIDEAATSADPGVTEWVPLVQYLRDAIDWTLEAHREMRAMLLDQDDGEDDVDDVDAVAR